MPLYKLPLISDPSDKLIEVHLPVAALKWNMQQRLFGRGRGQTSRNVSGVVVVLEREHARKDWRRVWLEIRKGAQHFA